MSDHGVTEDDESAAQEYAEGVACVDIVSRGPVYETTLNRDDLREAFLAGCERGRASMRTALNEAREHAENLYETLDNVLEDNIPADQVEMAVLPWLPMEGRTAPDPASLSLHHVRYMDGEWTDLAAPDPLHPNSKCTCHQEGTCDWCRRTAMRERHDEMRARVTASIASARGEPRAGPDPGLPCKGCGVGYAHVVGDGLLCPNCKSMEDS